MLRFGTGDREHFFFFFFRHSPYSTCRSLHGHKLNPSGGLLSQLLLNKESPQITQLPRTRHTQNTQLNQRPPDHARVDTLTLVAELGLPLPLEDLFPPYILQPRIDIPNFLHHLPDLVLVAALDLRSLADSHVEFELDPADLRAGEEEAGGRGDIGGGEAEPMVA